MYDWFQIRVLYDELEVQIGLVNSYWFMYFYVPTIGLDGLDE